MFAAAAIGLAMLLMGCSAAQPLRRSPASIRSSLLKRTPVGTAHEDVVTFVEREGWRFSSSKGSPPPSELEHPDTVGLFPDLQVTSTLHVSLGEYWAWPIFARRVWGEWLFDTNHHVLDIWVGKYTQGL